MATAPLTNAEARIIPINDADLIGLEALFDEQCREWLSLLHWDYTGPSRMIRQVARQRELDGFVAMSGSRTIGLAYYVVEDQRCSIGDIYVTRDWRGAGVDRQLVAAILDELERGPRLRRIESQCVSIDNEGASDLFAARGFDAFERYYMMKDLRRDEDDEAGLASTRPRQSMLSLDTVEVLMRGWQEIDFAQAARVIHQSYRGRSDSRINSQYKTEEGCAELLTILTDHLWCGDFLPHVSRVAVRRGTRRLAGVLIASRIAPRVGHIGQVSVHHAYQRQGLGRRLMLGVLQQLAQYGFHTATLAVTAINEPALRLYESLGFQSIHRFPVFVRERRSP
ncbi:MAG TPA: GNAT family N-acetyltransferase [Blastocatellia bacterium]|nr:GNAT family N-acetyltransferase [Blastocatellia bacterium]